MIGECLERGTEFGIVWSDDEGLRAVGCAMEITDVLERMDDGRMNILTRGTRPFRIVDEQHDLRLSGRHRRVPERQGRGAPTPRRRPRRTRPTASSSSRPPTASPTPTSSRR